MPFFDEAGTRYREQLEATKTALRIVAADSAVIVSSAELVQRASCWPPAGLNWASTRCRRTSSMHSGRLNAASSWRPARNSDSARNWASELTHGPDEPHNELQSERHHA